MLRALSHWCLCFVLLLTVQLLIGLIWSFFGPLGNGFERIIELVYGSPAFWLGNTFFENQMTLGNVPLGTGLLFLVAILYAILGGTVIYLICILSSALFHGKDLSSQS